MEPSNIKFNFTFLFMKAIFWSNFWQYNYLIVKDSDVHLQLYKTLTLLCYQFSATLVSDLSYH